MANPVWRYAEVLSVALLLVYALVNGLPSPRWVVPTALAVLLANAAQRLPADLHAGQFGWQVLQPGVTGIETWVGFKAGFAISWAPLTAAAVLLAIRRRIGWRRRSGTTAAIAATLVAGYAVVRVVDVWLALRPLQQQEVNDSGSSATLITVGLAVLPPLALGMTALALAAALAEHGRRVAPAGAVLLAVIALPYMDWSIGAVPLPLYAGDDTTLFAWGALMPSPSMPQPVPALTAMLELTAYLLLVAGLTGSRHRSQAATTEASS
ncbi:hypothetical protein [Micromonospora sp. NPDC023956]|uniref:hypothetical protein n=1 Tax=Micromonospora sp. NPDC023956 TaxID=3155722 RepID=UPI0033DB3920